jgi:hypothetical protein
MNVIDSKMTMFRKNTWWCCWWHIQRIWIWKQRWNPCSPNRVLLTLANWCKFMWSQNQNKPRSQPEVPLQGSLQSQVPTADQIAASLMQQLKDSGFQLVNRSDNVQSRSITDNTLAGSTSVTFTGLTCLARFCTGILSSRGMSFCNVFCWIKIP